MKTKLLVVPNFKTFERGYNEDGSYMLIHPQFFIETENTLFGHLCSNLAFAFSDLKYPNRTDFLNTIFGVDNWEFEFYEFITLDKFKAYLKKIENPVINVQNIIDLFKKYEGIKKHL